MAGFNRLISRFGKLIKLVIPYEKYAANGWEQMISQLLTAYDDLSATKGSFSKVYKIMCNDEWVSSSVDAYELLLPFVRDKQMRAFVTQKDLGFNINNEFIPFLNRGEVNRWNLVWAYSFWGRRYNENPENIQHLVAALKVLKDEIYAPGAPPPEVNKNIPPIEPFLESDLRSNEKIYPWKLYTDRVRVIEREDYEYDIITVEKNGFQLGLIGSKLDDNVMLNYGDLIDLTWAMEITHYYDGEYDTDGVQFNAWAQEVKMVDASAATRFEKKYGAINGIIYLTDISDEISDKILNHLMEYLLESKNPKVVEALKFLKGTPGSLRIQIADRDDWDNYEAGIINGYPVYLLLFRGEYDEKTQRSKDEILEDIMQFIYNPDTDTFYADVNAAKG
jgi:hypothetical protein